MRFNDHHKALAEDRILAFDTLFTTNQIQKFKILLPFLDNQMQKQMAIMIKLMELQYAISYFQNNPYQLCGCFTKETPVDFRSLISALSAYTDRHERQQMEHFMNIFQTMETYREVAQTFEMMKEFMPDMNFFGEGGIFGTSSDLNAAGQDSGSETADHGHENRTYVDDEPTHYNSFNNDRYENGSDENGSDENGSDENRSDENGSDKNEPNDPEKTNNDNMMKMLMSMLTPEQMQMFEMFGGKQFE